MTAKKITVNVFFILVFIILVNTVQTYVLHITKQFGDINFYKISTHIFGIFACLISLLSSILAWRFANKIQIKKISKITVAFLLAIFFYAVIISIYYLLERFLIFGLSTNFEMLVGNFVFTTVIYHLYISGLCLAYFYFQESAKTAIELKNTEREKEVLKYKILQKNLEPHFLFNNLSVLSGLIKKNPDEVESFVEDFSEVYRYYLKHTESELVPLEEELKFLKKYISLMKKRFKKAYSFTINIENENGYVLPCALQLCVENAIKHNQGLEEDPLKIYIEVKNDFIIVKNDFKPVDYTESSGLGNQFLEKSYLTNFGKVVVIEQTNLHYIVKIPLMK